jgi:hypothetical protein
MASERTSGRWRDLALGFSGASADERFSTFSAPCCEVDPMMKTTLHLHRPIAAPAASPDRLVTRRVQPTTVRLGIALSVAAALVTVLLEAILDVPVVAILVPVVVVGFALSWHACGRPLEDGRPQPSRDEATAGPPG